MEELTYTEYNCTTGETITRPLTDAERADYEAIKKLSAERLAEQEAEAANRAAAKASAEAKLAALGLTADEIAAL
jgi:hypothetical protein